VMAVAKAATAVADAIVAVAVVVAVIAAAAALVKPPLAVLRPLAKPRFARRAVLVKLLRLLPPLKPRLHPRRPVLNCELSRRFQAPALGA
jgi:hypothetical protein